MKPLEEIEKNGAHIVVRGFYEEQIEYILTQFDKNQLYWNFRRN